MPIEKSYSLTWDKVDQEKIITLLVDTHDFSEERVLSSLEHLHEQEHKQQQRTLGDF